MTSGPTAPSASSTADAPTASPSAPASTGPADASASATGTATDPGTEPGTDPGSGPGADPGTDPSPGTPAGPASEPGTPPDPPADPGPAAAAVKDVIVSEFRQTGSATATTTVTVVTDGTGPVTVDLRWSVADTAGGPGSPDGAGQVFRRSGATQYTVTAEHTFQQLGCYWTVTAATDPASADGGASGQLLTKRCDLR